MMFTFLRRLLLASLLVSALAVAQNSAPTQFNEFTVAQLQALMDKGTLTSAQLTKYYIDRITALDQNGPGVNAVIELNPDALVLAQNADAMRKKSGHHGPLLGIPILLKDNIDTGDKMQTTAGSFALAGTPAVADSTVAANLRAGGAVILGKTNLSEWANFRSFESISGWSGRGGQTHNPYGIDRNPCGSSSGSGAAASANFATVSLGTETDGSVVCPGNANGVVGLKPTVGLTSRAGVVPISHTQDTVGIHARTVADAAATLGVIQSRAFDGRDQATGCDPRNPAPGCGVPLGWQGVRSRPTNIPTDYTQSLDPNNGLNGARIGVTRVGLGGFDPFVPTPPPVLDAFESTVKVLTAAGATVVDLDAAGLNGPNTGLNAPTGEFLVLCYDFKNDLQKYFATRVGVPVAGGKLQSAIDFNNANAGEEMPFFNQDIFTFCNSMDTTNPDAPQPLFGGQTYNQALALDHAYGVNGIDAALDPNGPYHVDAVFTATDNPAWATDLLFGDHFIFGTSGFAAPEGYPIIQVPGAFPQLCASPTDPTNCTQYGVPLGVSFIGTAFSEPTLIKLASGFEFATQTRAQNLPTFAASAPSTNIQGTTITAPHRHAYPPAAKTPAKAPHHM